MRFILTTTSGLTLLLFVSLGQAELVYDTEENTQAIATPPAAPVAITAPPVAPSAVSTPSVAPAAVADPSVIAREELRAQQPSVSVAPAPSAMTYVFQNPTVPQAQSTAPPAVSNMSQSELIRRKRVRQELRNEDLLQTRMEELRLRDEERRTKSIVQQFPADQGQGVANPVFQSGNPSSVPVDGNAMPYQSITTSQSAPVPPQPSVPVQVVQQEASTSSSETFITLTPEFGTVGLAERSSLRINPIFSFGGTLGALVGDHIGIGLGYTYSRIGVSFGGQGFGTDPFVNNYQFYNQIYGFNGNVNDPIIVQQNIFDLNLKFFFTKRSSRIRPYVSGGFGYAKSFINYDRAILDYWNNRGINYLGQDYELDQWLGSVGGGVDIFFSDNFGIGAGFKYYGNIHTIQDNTFENNFFYTPYNGYYGGVNPFGFNNDADKRRVSNELANSGIWTLKAGVTMTF